MTLTTMLCAALITTAPASEFVRVAKDGWHFETATSRQRFVPFGGVYFDPATYREKPFPRFLVIGGFDEARTDAHFREIAKLGANVVRISLSTGIMCPEKGKLDESACRTLDRIIALASEHHLRVILDLMVEWEGRAKWMAEPWEQFTDEDTLEGLESYFRLMAERYRDKPTVFSYLVSDEPKIPWSSKGLTLEWEARASKLKLPADIPADENDPRSQALYQYQLMREDVAARFVKRMAAAIRSRDRNHMVSMGNLQWSAPLRVKTLTQATLKPSSYPAFSPRKIGPYLDYLHINCYDWWDANTACYALALGRYGYFPGKPVILGEFSFDKSVVEKCSGTFAGFCCWAFFPLPSEPAHHYLFDKSGARTTYAPDFAATAERLTSGKLALDRAPDQQIIEVPALSWLTDIPSAAETYDKCISACREGRTPCPALAKE